MKIVNAQAHWNGVYSTNAPGQVSWYRPHLEISLSLIERAAPDRSARIIDVGGGESTLIDDLLERDYRNLTVLDISQAAIDVTKARLGDIANDLDWLAADVTQVELPSNTYDVWHDRAAFHFLTDPTDRARYVQQARKTVKPGGYVIIGTFGPEGPAKCSGLDVNRYNAETLHGEFGNSFQLIEHLREIHETPFGTRQQFVYCICRRHVA